MSVESRAASARRELRKLWENPSPFHMPIPMKRWHTKYTRLICEFMIEHVPDERVVAWREVFTALHELVAHAYSTFAKTEWTCSEDEAWSAVSPDEHYAVAVRISLNPPGVEAEHFVDCIRRGDAPMSNGTTGLQVVQILEAASKSIAAQGAPISLHRS